ncbi:MAG TPA: hypothetical protein VII86_03685 [Thermoanaerobaculia bacterium]|jgi:hypothetical protein
MFQLWLRRALAALALTLAAALATVPDAGAAVHRPEARQAQARTVQKVRGSRLPEALTRILRKAGIEIDPNGFVDGFIAPILSDGGW